MSEVSPEGFLIDGRPHEWKMGRMPASEGDWITEVRLRVKDADTQLRLWADQRDELASLTQQVTSLTERNQQLTAEQKQPSFHLGRRPETPEEIDAELRFREIERRWEVELADRKHRADLAFEQSGLIRRAEGVRGWALVAVVFAIIASPWVAMIAGVAAKEFSLYVTPVTGIAGAIIGYWFGQGQQNPLQPPTIANSPTLEAPTTSVSRAATPGQ
ncbi:hypothetical protein PGH47_18345 [Streptomyces sp. HUAS 31]|uniref:hypothetical protein n=1 Tax=Streptomyces sp. HUAS 31 TaxID=3020055 RepID=UPI002305B3B8|nr:hypothetical protein [Streptomyces sp. HUAS 31]WCD97526.1 hypothetical protein PGH47_18345 [Streptomyces sp. HUAS 31]